MPKHPKLVRLFPLLLLILFICFPYLCSGKGTADESFSTLIKTGNTFVTIIDQAKPAVVHIVVKKVTNNDKYNKAIEEEFFNNQLMQDFFGPLPEREKKKNKKKPQARHGHGSGFIINTDGYILTNHHVVKDAVEIAVHLQDKREYKAKVIGSDPQSDVALIHIKAPNLATIALGNSDTLRVGEWAIAIGSPFEFIQTVTAGIISAKGRSSVGISEYEDFIQTDAAINPGNSGGPLLNIHGEAIGINTAFMTKTGGYMGVGFAVPINMAKTIAAQLQKHGKMTRGWLGVAIKDATPGELKSAGIQEYSAAAKVVRVKDDSPAERIKLEKDDLIVTLNKSPITGSADLRNRIALTSPKTKVLIEFFRDGERKEKELTIGQLSH